MDDEITLHETRRGSVACKSSGDDASQGVPVLLLIYELGFHSAILELLLCETLALRGYVLTLAVTVRFELLWCVWSCGVKFSGLLRCLTTRTSPVCIGPKDIYRECISRREI